jgi:hypothetical protein
LNSRLNSLKSASESPTTPPTEPTTNSSSDQPIHTRSKRLSKWPQGVADHCEQSARRRRG